MKKIIILLISTLLFVNTSFASNDLDSLKIEVSESLNETVKVLKDYFKKTDEELKSNKIKVEEAKEKAQALKESSKEKETNPVVLKQGLVEMPNCDADTEELAWYNDKWICRTPTYGTDCYPAKDEIRVDNGDGAFTCIKEGTYTNVSRGLSVCDGTDKTTQIACIFKNNKNGQEYQVEGSYCPSTPTPQRYKQACGENGTNSSCKCPAGYKYNNNTCKFYGANITIDSTTASGSYGRSVIDYSISNPNVNTTIIQANRPKYKYPSKTLYLDCAESKGSGDDRVCVRYKYGANENKCRKHNRIINFTVEDTSYLESVYLDVAYEDYSWVVLNGTVVHRSVDNSNKTLGVYEVENTLTGCNDNGSSNCNRKSGCPRKNVTQYIKNGTNKLEVYFIMAKAGYIRNKLTFNKKCLDGLCADQSPPLCKI